MPFKSKAQARYMWAKHPQIAEKWSARYGTNTKLPERKLKRSKSSR